MIEIREIENVSRDQLDLIAQAHRRAFPDFFLTQLGEPFLRVLYTGYVKDQKSGLIVAECDGRLVGFLAYSNDYAAFFKMLVRCYLLQFGWYSFLAVVRHPSFVGRLLRAFHKSDEVQRKERYVELASICCVPEAGRTGIGTLLIQHLKDMTDFSKYAYISLETDAENNEAANRFYRKNGFTAVRQYKTNEGRLMNEYRYSPEVRNETNVS